MTAIFEVTTNDAGKFQFDFIDTKGETLMVSKVFASMDHVEQAVKDVRVGSLMSEHIAVGSTDVGEKFFVIKDGAGEVLVKSILFDNEMRFNNALHSVRDSACVAELKHSPAG